MTVGELVKVLKKVHPSVLVIKLKTDGSYEEISKAYQDGWIEKGVFATVEWDMDYMVDPKPALLIGGLTEPEKP